MVVLVTGGKGQLGQALQSIAGNYPQIELYLASSAEADIANPESLEAIFNKIQPQFCINAAAYTTVDKAESEPEKAYEINVTGAKNLAQACHKFGTTLLHISTDFVFDGQQQTPYTETDATNPQGVYGLTKWQGEQAIAAVFDQYYIVRTSWLYSAFGHNFMKTMLRVAAERPSLNVVNDQIGTPTEATTLADALLQMIRSGKQEYGIYHYSNEGVASWYDFAAEIFAVNGVKIELNAIPTAAYPTPAKRPKYSVLDKTKIKSVFGIQIPDWQTALKQA
ncbi:dTDP-4-dehydrorhamnose reductase [Flavobacterium sp.]|uniref:dTDP-4-dehydrorhamnose reductase n=1 Tax=Flavobacterium sp. TaxID=239 RepID=UPI0039E2B564